MGAGFAAYLLQTIIAIYTNSAAAFRAAALEWFA